MNTQDIPALIGRNARFLKASFTLSRLPDSTYQVRLGEQVTIISSGWSPVAIANMMIIMVQSHAIRTRLNELQGGAL